MLSVASAPTSSLRGSHLGAEATDLQNDMAHTLQTSQGRIINPTAERQRAGVLGAFAFGGQAPVAWLLRFQLGQALGVTGEG